MEVSVAPNVGRHSVFRGFATRYHWDTCGTRWPRCSRNALKQAPSNAVHPPIHNAITGPVADHE